jgi:hypothetical protein
MENINFKNNINMDLKHKMSGGFGWDLAALHMERY